MVRSHKQQEIHDNSNGQRTTLLHPLSMVLRNTGMAHLAPSRYHLQELLSPTLGGWRSGGESTNRRRLGWQNGRTTFGTASVVREVGYKGLWQDIVKNSATAVLRWFKRFWCLPKNNNWIKLIHLYRITNLKYKYLWCKILSYLGNYWSARICRGRIFDELNKMDHFSHGDYMTGKKPVVP